VNQENATGLEPKNQILAAPADARDALAMELRRDGDRVERTRQPRVRDLDAFEAPAGHDGLQPGANRLDLGQLGHGRPA
jgi:hypothetical protein